MKLISSLTLTLILACSAYAGNMQNPAPQPPPQVVEPTKLEVAETTTDAQTTTIIEVVMSILGLL